MQIFMILHYPAELVASRSVYRFGYFPRITCTDIVSSAYAVIILPGECMCTLCCVFVEITAPFHRSAGITDMSKILQEKHNQIGYSKKNIYKLGIFEGNTYRSGGWPYQVQHKVSHVIKIFVIFPFLGNVIVGGVRL